MKDKIQNPFLEQGQSLKSVRKSQFGKGTFSLMQKMITVCICLAIFAFTVSVTVIKRRSLQKHSSTTCIQPNTYAKQLSTKRNNLPSDPSGTDTNLKPISNNQQSNDDILAKHNQAMLSTNSGKTAKAIQLFSELCNCNSAIIEANAEYQLAVIKQDDSEYFQAYQLAHQALNTINFINDETGQFTDFKNTCNLLIAESLGNYTLSLKQDTLKFSWLSLAPEKIDLLEGLTQPQAEQIVFAGVRALAVATEKPLVETVSDVNSSQLYNIACNDMPLEDLLLRITSLDCFDLRYENLNGSEYLKKRPITLCVKDATIDKVIEKATAAAGLLARIERSSDSAIIYIIDPSHYQSLSAHIKMMNEFAKNRWTSFLLTCDNDSYSAAAHIALGLLQKQNDHPLQAIAQFQIVSENFYQSVLAPLALLYSAQTKTSIKDYNSAIDDLTLLVEQYSSSRFFHQGYLELADIQFKTRNYKQAARINEKVYTTETSTEIKTKAAYAAAQCYYQNGDNKNTHKWLSRYFDIASDAGDIQYPKALLTLGTTCSNMQEYDQANQAFLLALKTNLSPKDYSTAAFGLTNSLLKTDDVSSALGVLDNIDTWQLNPSQAIMMLQIKSRIYYRIGLTEKAIAVLINKLDIITEPNLKANVALQLAQYLKEAGQLEKACRMLTTAITDSDDYRQTQAISIALADICLAQGNYGQATSTCHKLLGNDLSSEAKQQVLDILANAYKAKGQYRKAALVLLGQVPQKNEKTLSLNSKSEQVKVN